MGQANSDFNDFQRGLATPMAPNWRDIRDTDSRPLPEPYLTESSPNLGTAKIPPERYTSYDFHRQECQSASNRDPLSARKRDPLAALRSVDAGREFRSAGGIGRA